MPDSQQAPEPRKSAVDLYQEAEDYVFSLISGPPTPDRDTPKAEIRRRALLRLDRMRAFLAFIGNPHESFRAIHIGGTSGKGSTATFTDAILSAAGYRTGLHVSPYLQVATEKLVVDDHIASAQRYNELVTDLAGHAARWVEKGHDPLTYGEFWVALSFKYLAEENVEFGVIEVGAGGRFDLTNVISPEVAAITSIGLDHTVTLGNTVEEIAWHKAGIIKSGLTAITAVSEPGPYAVIEHEAREVGAKLIQVSQPDDYRLLDVGPEGARFLDARSDREFQIRLPGAFQAANAATAIAIARAIPDVDISDDQIAAGLAQARFAGRMEIVQSEPLVLLDGAHNPQKMQGLTANLAPIIQGRKTVVVFGVLESKNFRDMLTPLAGHASVLIATSPKVYAKPPVEASEIAEKAVDLVPEVHAEPDPLAAIDLALRLAAPSDAVIVTGSLYLVGNVRERWYPTERILTQGTMWPVR